MEGASSIQRRWRPCGVMHDRSDNIWRGCAWRRPELGEGACAWLQPAGELRS